MQTNSGRENFGSAKISARGIFNGNFTASSLLSRAPESRDDRNHKQAAVKGAK
jgi:hypothetical protein